ncbi:MAG: 2Fe-2S ferredoxin [Deltaproteobacteria bacterium]|nr:2Fe-2S ferredoxin [Deltaproteobacteria bacterium]|tara:strand:- start:2411 stop:2716 length:306 start_codon:yes stop_codon:yes gene_type:complete
MTTTHKVTFLPLNKTVETTEGMSILETALAFDVDLEHACGGFCACTTCHVIIEENEDGLSEMQFDEEDKLDTCEGVTLRSRLGCQSRVEGDVVVRIPPKPY